MSRTTSIDMDPEDFPQLVELSDADDSENDDGALNNTSVEGKHKIAYTAFELANRVASLVEDLKPWRALMPSALREKMAGVRVKAQQIEDLKYEPDEPLVPQWGDHVLHLSMETWNRDGPFRVKGFRNRPAIVAYYRNPPSDEGGQGFRGIPLPPGNHLEHTALGDERNLQRVYILSPELEDEIQLLTSIVLQRPTIVPPPYKILLEYYPEFKARLRQLEELQKSNATATSSSDNEGTRMQEEQRKQNDRDTGIPLSPEESQRNNFRKKKADDLHLSSRTAQLRCLVTFIEDNLGDLIQLRSQIADRSLKEIAFEDLWHLFKPGDFVYSRDPSTGHERLFRVYYITGGLIKRRKLSRYEESDYDRYVDAQRKLVSVGCWTPLLLATYTMEFDGNRAGPQICEILIKHYSGKRPITDLTAYPVYYHPDKNILARFEEIGRKFMTSVGHRYYDGLSVTVTLKPGFDGPAAHVQRSYDNIVSEVYVDFEEFLKVFNDLRPPLLRGLENPILDPTENSETDSRGGMNSQFIQYRGHEEVDAKLSEIFSSHNRKSLETFDPIQEPDRLTPDFYQLLPQEVPAYAFRHRKWYLLDINHVQPINHSRYSGFDDLVIPEHYKSLLTALVNNHTSSIQKRAEKIRKQTQGKTTNQPKMDIVPGKGEGLIILLHGPPGAGKTSTAETIAAYTRRPLYSITCGDIGLVPREAENLLETHTLRADKWGCVLLLDEADVFLMQRTWKEIQRNALVSVFLRQLEYYSGILFLTTNRPGTIDEAFKSRIHVSLRYPGIDLQATRQMWENILTRLEKENETAEIRVEFNRENLLSFAEQHYKRRLASHSCWNGRQIRNAFQTALALGHAARRKVLDEAGITDEDLARALMEGDGEDDGSGNGNGRAEKRRLRKKYMTVKLTVASFKGIAKTTNEFEDYIVALRGKDSEAARDDSVRDDGFDPERGDGARGGGGLNPMNSAMGMGTRRDEYYGTGGRTTTMGSGYQHVQHSPSMSVVSASSSSTRGGLGGNNAEGGWGRYALGGGGGDGYATQGGGTSSPEIMLNGGRYTGLNYGNNPTNRGSMGVQRNRFGLDSSEYDDDDEEFEEDDDDDDY